MQKNKIKSWDTTQKNPHWRGALFWRTRRIHSAIYCLRVNRNVSNCALLVLNYLLSNACASKSRIAAQKIPTGVGLCFGAPGAIRTRSPRLRRAMLYPVEPRVQGLHIIIICIKKAIYFIVCSRCKHAIIKSSKSPSKTASESVFSTPVRTSLTNWYGYKT